MSDRQVVVIGSSNMDLVIRTPRIPRAGETILGGEFVMVAGGKGANQAVAAARLGAKVYFVARVGRDPFGDKMLANFRAEGIATDYIIRDERRASGVATIAVDAAGENSIIVAPGANAALSPADVEAAEEAIAGADSILLQLEVPLETVARAADLAASHGVRVILDPAPAQPLPASLLSKISLITPNETEAEVLTGVAGTDEAAARRQSAILRERGVAGVLVTRGRQGSLLNLRREVTLFGTEPVESVDSTAAGDCFNGALAARLAAGADLPEAIRFASRAAALSTTRLGAQDSLPRLAELER